MNLAILVTFLIGLQCVYLGAAATDDQDWMAWKNKFKISFNTPAEEYKRHNILLQSID